jgi:hypothetical protein
MLCERWMLQLRASCTVRSAHFGEIAHTAAHGLPAEHSVSIRMREPPPVSLCGARSAPARQCLLPTVALLVLHLMSPPLILSFFMMTLQRTPSGV